MAEDSSITDEQEQKPAAPVRPAARTSTRKETDTGSRGGTGSVLAVFLSLVAIGIASYPAWELYQARYAPVVDPNAAKIAEIESGTHGLAQGMDELRADLAEITGRLDARATEDFASRDYVDEEVGALRAVMGSSAQDWIFAEVEYLVRMANQRALMEEDSAAALQLLTSADEIIREAEGIAAHGLREALARDIAALKAVESPDVQGIYLELSALISQVPELRRNMPVYEAPVAAEAAPEPTTFTGRLMKLITDMGQKLAGLVDFRRGQLEVTPLLPPEEEYFLRQNLVLKLQIAQMALLEGNGPVFSTATGEAEQWVQSSFDTDAAGTQAMLDSLERLNLTEIDRNIPDISGSLRAARRHMAGVTTSTTAEVPAQ